MPKELIVDTTEGLPEQDAQRFAAQVTWGREAAYVQIATVDLNTPEHERAGFYVSLRRSEINRLIRVLRKARDQAYGMDA